MDGKALRPGDYIQGTVRISRICNNRLRSCPGRYYCLPGCDNPLPAVPEMECVWAGQRNYTIQQLLGPRFGCGNGSPARLQNHSECYNRNVYLWQFRM